MKKRLIAGAAAVALGLGLAPAATAQEQLSTAEVATLSRMRDEERMARDLYQAFIDAYGSVRPFSNIVYSEQRHYDAIGTMLDRFGVDDPSAGLPTGTYADAEIQALYDSWLAQGSTSLRDAYAVGVELETADIADLEDAIDESGNASLDATYQNLLDASRNHLSAFQRASSGGGMGGGGMGGGFRWRGSWG